VGQAGLIVRTQNGGLSWAQMPTHITGNLFGVTSTPDGQVTAVGQRVGLHSKDAGASWTTLGALDLALNWYSSVTHSASARSGEVIAVGHGGRIVRLAP
jgi:photosystem II stability/assembly factor-like uncharacterized protein